MFSVLFEVHPKADQWEDYLGYATMLRPELERIDGFVDNIRYASLTREGWILSLSGWDTEKALVRWRTQARHHDVQDKGRSRILSDYHLRVGQITTDTRLPHGHRLVEQRLDETETGEATTVILIDTHCPSEEATAAAPADLATRLGLNSDAPGLVSWDVFDAVPNPGNVIVLLSWRDHVAADAYRATVSLPGDVRLRQVRVVRDYGMYDRRENPQYYPEITQP